MAKLPPLISLLSTTNVPSKRRDNVYRYGMLILTFFAYMSYHISRKPLSIVKSELHRNCSNVNGFEFSPWLGSHAPSLSLEAASGIAANNLSNHSKNGTWCDFAPFDKPDYKSLLGELDYAFLFTYAIGMFFSGMIAERVPLRYFLSIGMVLSGIFTAMFGIGSFAEIHSISFYIVAQVLNGLVQSTGWPGVVTCVGNWFGKERRGFIMGVWNSHTSFGNIFGSIIASAFVSSQWGLSFIVPGAIIAFLGFVCFLALIESPNDVRSGVTYYQPIPVGEENENFKNDSNKNYNGIQNSEEVEINVQQQNESKPISFFTALKIPGVLEFAFCLLFAKLVSYTFLYWLPFYIKHTSTLSTTNSGLMSTLFDVGGIFGGITAGLISDRMSGRAITCGMMLIFGAVMMYLYNTFASVSMTMNIVLLINTGIFVNGPYALITTAVSADLGTHAVLKGNAKALSTVTAIIDGTGSIGAAIGPLLTGLISKTGWNNVFYMLISANMAALLLLSRLLWKEIHCLFHPPVVTDQHSSLEATT